MDFTTLIDLLVALAALGASLFLAYGAWLVATRNLPRPVERARTPMAHGGKEAAQH